MLHGCVDHAHYQRAKELIQYEIDELEETIHELGRAHKALKRAMEILCDSGTCSECDQGCYIDSYDKLVLIHSPTCRVAYR